MTLRLCSAGKERDTGQKEDDRSRDEGLEILRMFSWLFDIPRVESVLELNEKGKLESRVKLNSSAGKREQHCI